MTATRLSALHSTGLLDAVPSPELDRLTRLATGLLDAPVALVSLVDEDRQFFASAVGLPEPWASRRETPLTHSFCLHTIRSTRPLVVADARVHPVLRDNLAIRDLDAIAYAGIPLVVREEPIGAFCVIDHRPREWSDEQVRLLDDLSSSVISEILLRMEIRAGAQQRALTDALLESLGDGVLAVDLQSTFLVANSAARRWFETAEAGTKLPADWAQMHRATLPDGTALSPRDGPLGRALRGEPTDGLAFTLQGPTAPEPSWVEASGRPVRDRDGKLVAAVAVYRDIGERMRQAEEKTALTAQLAVQRRERNLATILDSVGDALIVADAERRVEHLNPEAESLTGWAASDAVGRPLADVMHVREGEGDALVLRARDGHERLIARSESVVRLPGLGGSVAPPGPRSDGASSAGDSGELLGAVVVFRDVTAQRELQRQLELSTRLASLGTLAAGIGHEINNPLASVVGNASFVLDELRRIRDAGVVDAASLAEAIRAQSDLSGSADRVAAIVSALRVFGRPGAPEASAGESDVARTAEWAVRATAHELDARARVTTDIPAGLYVALDDTQLGQVLVNLLVNAAHAMDGAAEENTVSLGARGEAGTVVVEVRDTGAGMAPEVARRVFEPFFTTKPVGSGRGLGLAACHGIVTSAGGRMEVESLVGKGTTFRVVLPARPPAVPALPSAPAPRVPPRAARILAIDDEPTMLRVLKRSLPDHEVVCVNGAREALAVLADDVRFDLIVTDMTMPGMSGKELYEQILARDPGTAAKMVFLTGGVTTADAAEFLDRAPNVSLMKPLFAAPLRALIAETLAKHR